MDRIKIVRKDIVEDDVRITSEYDIYRVREEWNSFVCTFSPEEIVDLAQAIRDRNDIPYPKDKEGRLVVDNHVKLK